MLVFYYFGKRCLNLDRNKSNKSNAWEFSSVGLEHLPYKQRVGGSNPSTPTLLNVKNIKHMTLEIRNYRDYKGEKCLQILPCINYWYKHLDPDYTNALFIGWLWWGICIHFDK